MINPYEILANNRKALEHHLSNPQQIEHVANVLRGEVPPIRGIGSPTILELVHTAEELYRKEEEACERHNVNPGPNYVILYWMAAALRKAHGLRGP